LLPTKLVVATVRVLTLRILPMPTPITAMAASTIAMKRRGERRFSRLQPCFAGPALAVTCAATMPRPWAAQSTRSRTAAAVLDGTGTTCATTPCLIGRRWTRTTRSAASAAGIVGDRVGQTSHCSFLRLVFLCTCSFVAWVWALLSFLIYRHDCSFSVLYQRKKLFFILLFWTHRQGAWCGVTKCSWHDTSVELLVADAW